jgi:hypothetical protein
MEMHELAAVMREKKINELLQVWDALVKREKPLSPDEIHFIWTYCYIRMLMIMTKLPASLPGQQLKKKGTLISQSS